MGNPEKRKYRRVKGVFRVNAERQSDFTIDWSCDSRDISEGGIGLMESREPIVGDKVEVSFILPGSGHKMTIESKVVWTRQSESNINMYESGVEFLEIDASDRKLLRDYVYSY